MVRPVDMAAGCWEKRFGNGRGAVARACVRACVCVCMCVCVVRQGRGSGVHKMFGWDPISGVPSRVVVGWLLVTTTQQQITHTHPRQCKKQCKKICRKSLLLQNVKGVKLGEIGWWLGVGSQQWW